MTHAEILKMGLKVYKEEGGGARTAVERALLSVVLAEREACREEALYEKRMAEERLADQKRRHCEERHLAEVRGQVQAAYWVAKHIRERGETP